MNAKNTKKTQQIDGMRRPPRMAVRDLPAPSVSDRTVVGGFTMPRLYEAVACKGTHLPEVGIELWR